MEHLLKPENLILALDVLLPGVVAMLIYDVRTPSERRDWSKPSLEAAVYGGLNYVVLRPAFEWLHLNWATASAALTVPVALLLHVVSPAILAVTALKGLRWLAGRGLVHHPTRTAWDRAFEERAPCWIRVRLKDGGHVGGRWDGRAMAGDATTTRDLYLETTWILDDDGAFVRSPSPRQSLLLREDDITLIEFIEDAKEKQNEPEAEINSARLPAEEHLQQQRRDSRSHSSNGASDGLADEFATPIGPQFDAAPKKVEETPR